jgi:hypothetical protein
MRQSDPKLIQAIQEVSTGFVSDSSDKFIKQLERPLPEEGCVRLMSTNIEGDFFNADKLFEMQGDFHIYTAVDEGDQHYLRRLLASKELYLKLQCPVIILRNLSQNIVNGMRGVVVKMEEHCVQVQLDDGRVITIERVMFTRFQESTEKILASHLQIPLKPAFALTFHKAQGKIFIFLSIHVLFAFNLQNVDVLVNLIVILYKCYLRHSNLYKCGKLT